MRMSDPLGPFTVKPEDYKNDGYLKKYVPAIEKISAVMGIPAAHWQVFEDSNQISTRKAGNRALRGSRGVRGCISCFFAYPFRALRPLYFLYTLFSVIPAKAGIGSM